MRLTALPSPCLPSGGSTDDQQNSHKTGEMSAKERRQMIREKKK